MAENEKKDEKKIFIDEDWKQQAKKEKEVLAAEEESQKAGSRRGRATGNCLKGISRLW